MSEEYKKWNTKVHFAVESAFDGGLTEAAGTFASVLPGFSVGFRERTIHEDEAFNGTRGANDRILGRGEPIPFTIPMNLHLQPGADTASPAEIFILGAMGAAAAIVTDATQTVLADSTKTLIKVTDGSVFAEFDAIRIGSESAVIIDITGNDLTIDPPLLNDPVTTTPIDKTRTMHLGDAQPSVAINALKDRGSFWHGGGVVTDMTIESPGTDKAKITITGELASQVFTGSATLAGAIDNVVTTIPVNDVANFDVGSVFDIGTETGIVVSAIDKTASPPELTVTRGGSPDTHSIDDLCFPTFLDGSISGAIAHGSAGRSRRGESDDPANPGAISIAATTRSFKLETGAQLINDEDGFTDSAQAGPTGIEEGARVVTGSRTLHLRDSSVRWMRQAQELEHQPELFQIVNGDRGLGIYINRASMGGKSLSEDNVRNISGDYKAALAVNGAGDKVANREVVIFTW